jgi:hypothetical protein
MVFEKAETAVRAGSVSEAERAMLLTSYYGTTQVDEAIARTSKAVQQTRRPAQQTQEPAQQKLTPQIAPPLLPQQVPTPQPTARPPAPLTIRDLLPQVAQEASEYGTASPGADSADRYDANDDTGAGGYTWRIIAVVALFAIIVTGLFATLFWSTGGITGAVVYEQAVGRTLADGDIITLNLTNATKLIIDGTVSGVGNARIILRASDGDRGLDRELYGWQRGAVRTAHASLAKSWYAAGETVEYIPDTSAPGSIVSAYLMAAGQATPIDSTTLQGLAPGEYTITLIIDETAQSDVATDDGSGTNATNETIPPADGPTDRAVDEAAAEPVLVQERLSFTIAAEGSSVPSMAFETCGEACALPGIEGPASIVMEADDGVTVRIDRVVFTSGNEPPQLATAVADSVGERRAIIDLHAAFTDPDGDPLTFDIGAQEGFTTEIADGILTVQSESAGTATFIAYASDGKEVTPSNLFSVTITMPAVDTNTTNGTTQGELTTNESVNETQNGSGAATPAEEDTTLLDVDTIMTNGTGNATDNQTSNQTGTSIEGAVPTSPAPVLDECADPDPNKQPASCLQGAQSNWFRPEVIILEDKTARSVGQLTPIGNLLIRGDLVTGSTATPASTDYQLGYRDEDGDFVPTLWVDSQTGDLHLRGQLTEANGNIAYQDGLSAFTNQRSIILALVNPRTGDLTLRGNLVPYRRTFG